MNVRNLTRAFNEKFGMSKPESAITTVLYKKKIRCGRKGNERLIELVNRLLTDQQDAFVRRAYKKYTVAEVTEKLNQKFGTDFKPRQIDAYCTNHRILSGRTGCFKKGIKPWNKGVKGSIPANSGSFKPGSIPPNVNPLYSERLSKDGQIEIKVPVPYGRKGTSSRYMPKSRWVYLQHVGPIPRDKVVSFRDGDPSNFAPDNLILLSKAEMLKLNQNGYRKSHDDLKPNILALSKLQAKVGELRNKHK